MKPTIEEVKEYFKDAETVENKYGKIIKVDLKNNIEQLSCGSVVQGFNTEEWVCLFHDKRGYAKILTYKKPIIEKTIKGKKYKCIENVVMTNGETFYYKDQIYTSDEDGCITNVNGNTSHYWSDKKELNTNFVEYIVIEEPKEEAFVITKEQIQELQYLTNSISGKYIDEKLKDWFPSTFVEDKKELVVGKWYKNNSGDKLFCFSGEYDNDGDPRGYGFFNRDTFMKNNSIGWGGSFIPADPEEVKLALEKEAVKRYKVGDTIERLENYYYGINDIFTIDNVDFKVDEVNCVYVIVDEWNLGLFKDGKWATIIKPKQMTQSDIEKELGYKIEILK